MSKPEVLEALKEPDADDADESSSAGVSFRTDTASMMAVSPVVPSPSRSDLHQPLLMINGLINGPSATQPS
jgi:hypothetical protein